MKEYDTNLQELIVKLNTRNPIIKRNSVLFRMYRNRLYAILPGQNKIVDQAGIVLYMEIGDLTRNSKPATKNEYKGFYEKLLKEDIGLIVVRTLSLCDLIKKD